MRFLDVETIKSNSMIQLEIVSKKKLKRYFDQLKSLDSNALKDKKSI